MAFFVLMISSKIFATHGSSIQEGKLKIKLKTNKYLDIDIYG